MNEKILLVAVDYNSNYYTKLFLESINKLHNRDHFEIHVGFTGKNTLKECQPFQFHYFPNVGYFGAVNMILERVSISKYNAVIVCNNDIEIETLNIYDKILQHSNKYDVLAPRIFDNEGKDQNPHRLHPPSFRSLLKYKIYFSSFIIAKIIFKIRRKVHRKNLINKSQLIYSPHGAFIIFNNSYFTKGGLIDSNFFLYGEEDSIGAICHSKKMKIYLDLSIKVKHFASVSTGKGLSIFKWKEQKKAFQYLSNSYRIFKIIK